MKNVKKVLHQYTNYKTIEFKEFLEKDTWESRMLPTLKYNFEIIVTTGNWNKNVIDISTLIEIDFNSTLLEIN